MLPENLILVRHGESAGNAAMNAAKGGDLSHYTEEYVNKPGATWPLTERGQVQAQTAGAWLQQEFETGFFKDFKHSRRHYVSPLTRTQQTARFMKLVQEDYVDRRSVEWRLNRSIRERDWGDIDTVPLKQYRTAKIYENSARKERIDPLYWRPPGGESIADVAENRVRNFFDTLHRECSGQDVVAVTHGEFIRATLLMLLRANDETYIEWEKDSSMRVKNCEVFHFTRRVPGEEFLGPWEKPGSKAENRIWPTRNHVAFYRRSYPSDITGTWEMINGPWTPINYTLPTNDDLL